MNIDFYNFRYHDTICEDGITHVVQTDRYKNAYNVTITENYYDCKNENECKHRLIYDLHMLKRELQEELEQRNRTNKRF